jgi:signal peptidase I
MREAAVVMVGLAVIGSAVLWARRRLVLVTVYGESMEPTLRDGDRVLVRRRRPADLSRGDIAVLAAPDGARAPEWRCPGWHVKRVVALPGDPMPDGVASVDDIGRVSEGTVVVFGDNPTGGDSRHWGPYPTEGLVGTTVCRTWRAGRSPRPAAERSRA